ncbi:MAG: NOB1 family endonuclease [Candidatus Nanohaloarchaea archaeon]
MKAVLDANVFIRGKGLPDFDRYYTVPVVMEELESSSSRLSFDTTQVEVREPDRVSLAEVEEKADEIHARTSEVDERLVALALETGSAVISDDMGLQNLASHLDVEFQSYLGDEIDEQRCWKMVCQNCGAEVEGERCGRCGSTQVQRKPGQCSSG